MSTGFQDLPSELRNQIYQFVLLQEEPIHPFEPWRPNKLASSLFRANKTIHRETTFFFYSQKVFDVTEITSGQLLFFLDLIGNDNAGSMRHIIIDFPAYMHLDHGDVALEPHSVKTLEVLQDRLASLKTLEISLDSTDSMETMLDGLYHDTLATEALEMVDTHFRDIPFTQEIILNFFGDGPSD